MENKTHIQNQKLSDICSVITDGSHFSPTASLSGYPMFSVKDMREYDFDRETCKLISKVDFEKMKKSGCIPQKGDVLVAKDGSYLKEIFVCKETREEAILSSIALFRPNQLKCDSKYLCYALKSPCVFEYIKNNCVSGSALPRIILKAFRDVYVPIPPLITQRKIASILSAIDDKIELNNRMNENLMDQTLAKYKNIFHNIEDRKVCAASQFFDITIGKTPPRKETQWFTKDINDVRWVSISDMGNCGVYISDTNERLTHKAIDKYNVVLIPDNTIILSFKLTVGRIAISDGTMATNEAIAHFKTEKKEYNPYLYCYLKCFKYGELGSTSSIATAVNSKIIKAMPFVIPNENELHDFNKTALVNFEIIKNNEKENKRLTELRDTLLPKLMSGEIDVDSVEL